MADEGVCGAAAPPLLGDVLTGAGITLQEAAERLAHGDPLPELSAIQRRIVEDYAARA